MAQRAGADIVEVEGSHVIMVSQPQAVTNLILKAVRTRPVPGHSGHDHTGTRRLLTGMRS
jgi:hypothetical protein